MAEFPIEFASRQIRRTFERAIGRSIAKIITELATNSDDSYRRLSKIIEQSGANTAEDPAPIIILFERARKRFSVIDHAEGITDKDMRDRFSTYGGESVDRVRGYKTRSLFGKGLRDVLFTQKHGQVKSIKNGLFYNCRFKWKDAGGGERAVLDVKAPSRVTPELRTALHIPENGTLVEFVLADEVSNPQFEKLASTLSRFYMMRMVNSSPHREVMLVAPGRRGDETRQLSYQFPAIESKDRLGLSMATDLGTQIQIEGEIGITEEELSQGEAAYTDREGGLLVLDEDDAVLDLQLFGFDDDPAARRVSGVVKLLGAGNYIRTKLNQPHPEEVLTETRDGFSREHQFYRELRTILHARLEPLVAKLRELGPKPKVTISDRTRERHQEALDILNHLASQMLGPTARVPTIPANRRTPPIEGIAFVQSHISVRTGLATPAALLINTTMVETKDLIEITSNSSEILVEPLTVMRGEYPAGAGAVVKIVRVRCDIPDLTGMITARWKNVQAAMDVTTTLREVLTPVNGLEFERDAYNIRLGASRHLRLFIDRDKVPVESEISLTVDGREVELAKPRIIFESTDLITPKVGQVEILARGAALKRNVVLTASCKEYVAGTSVTVIRRDKPERGGQGLFKGYRFQPLERKVQSLWLPEGYILINTKDPVNSRYFGENPGTAVEENAYCQVRLADLILNECLQIMVAQALEAGRLDRRFPNNPEIDVRNYVDEKKFEIGATIHEKFVTKV